MVEAALRADPAALPGFAGVDLGEQGYAVVKVNKVLPREAQPDAVARQDRDQYVQAWGSAENLAYYNLLKDRLKVQITGAQAFGLRAGRTDAVGAPAKEKARYRNEAGFFIVGWGG